MKVDQMIIMQICRRTVFNFGLNFQKKILNSKRIGARNSLAHSGLLKLEIFMI